MAFTQTDVDNLKAAMKSGVKSMTFANQSYEFQTADDYLKLLVVMQQEVNAAAGTSRSFRLARTSKGV